MAYIEQAEEYFSTGIQVGRPSMKAVVTLLFHEMPGIILKHVLFSRRSQLNTESRKPA
jgi:hypothetical protein